MPRLGRESRNSITFPNGISNDHRHLGVTLKNIECIVSTCIVIRNNGINLGADIVERIAQNQ